MPSKKELATYRSEYSYYLWIGSSIVFDNDDQNLKKAFFIDCGLCYLIKIQEANGNLREKSRNLDKEFFLTLEKPAELCAENHATLFFTS